MQKRDLEDLALDLEELLLLLKEVETRKELVPVAERHINRLMKTLEAIKENFYISTDNVPVSDDKVIATLDEENLTEEESITIEEEVISPQIIEQYIEPFEEQDQTTEIKEEASPIIRSATVLGEQLRPAAELSKGLTLNDTFRFSRELFNGDKDEMNRALQEVSKMNSLADVTSYLSSQIEWNEENDTVKDFIELLKKYFV